MSVSGEESTEPLLLRLVESIPVAPTVIATFDGDQLALAPPVPNNVLRHSQSLSYTAR